MKLKEDGNVLFPVFLKLHQLNLLLIGGGYVALEKLEALLKNSPNAKVHIVGKEILQEEIKEMVDQHPFVTLDERPFAMSDLEGRDVVICATDQYQLHVEVKQACEARHILCNVADTPDLCDFYLSSVVKKGNLKIAISSNGKSPTLTKRIREYLEEAIPEDIDQLLDKLKEIRDQLKGDFEYKVKTLNEVTKSWKNKGK
jgi:siroheme synthase-like protein